MDMHYTIATIRHQELVAQAAAERLANQVRRDRAGNDPFWRRSRRLRGAVSATCTSC